MKKHFLIPTIFIALMISFNQIEAQPAQWLWAKGGGTCMETVGNDVCTDPSGNVIVTGYFHGDTILFSNNTFLNGYLYGYNFFIAKYDANGNMLWARTATPNGNGFDERGLGVVADVNGNIYVVGQFWCSSLTFGSTMLNNSLNQYGEIFFVKYDANGNVVWAKKFGNNGNDWGYKLAKDSNGNIYMCGGFGSKTIAFGSTTLTILIAKTEILIGEFASSIGENQ